MLFNLHVGILCIGNTSGIKLKPNEEGFHELLKTGGEKGFNNCTLVLTGYEFNKTHGLYFVFHNSWRDYHEPVTDFNNNKETLPDGTIRVKYGAIKTMLVDINSELHFYDSGKGWNWRGRV